MSQCEPWHGQFSNPYVYQSQNCGEVEVFTARKMGWSCSTWEGEHDAAVLQMQQECPPV